MRSESWHVFWIGSERLSEMEHYSDIGREGAVMCAGAKRREDEKRKVMKAEP